MKVITYARVSTDEQAEKGFSLRHQEDILKQYCKLKRWNQIAHYNEDSSAKTFNRPEWNKLVNYIKENRKQVDAVLFTKWDRFSRNHLESRLVIDEFKKMGVQLISIEQPLDFENPDSKILLSFYLTLPEVENDKISIRTKEGMRRCMKEGCFPGRVPYGYSRTRNFEGKTTLKPHPSQAKTVEKAFDLFSTGAYSMEEVRRIIQKDGYKGNKEAFRKLLLNRIYIGKIVVKPYRNEPEQIVEGLHAAIIPDEVFYKVQDLINGRRKQPNSHKKINGEYPLKGILFCQRCGGKLTASKSRGRRKKYGYYHCQNGCPERIPILKAHDSFESWLHKWRFKKEITALYREVIKDALSQDEGDKERLIEELTKQKKLKQNNLQKLEDKFINDELSSIDYNKIRDRYEKDMIEIKSKIETLKTMNKQIIDYLEFGVSLMGNLPKFFSQSETDVKQRIIGSIFGEKLIFSNGKYRTINMNAGMSLLVELNQQFTNHKLGKTNNFAGLTTKAPPLGLEPRTY